MKSPLAYWDSFSLTIKFRLIFSLLFLFILFIGASSYLCFLYIHKAEKTIQQNMRVERLILQMDLGQQKARQLLNAFFLFHQQSGLQKAHERYAQPSINEITHVIALSNELKDILFRSTYHNSNKQIKQSDIDLYLASAKHFAKTSAEAVELLNNRSGPESGIQDRLRSSALRVAKELSSCPELQVRYSSMVLSYKDYLLTRQKLFMNRGITILGELQKSISQNSPFSQEKKQNLNRQLDDLVVLAMELMGVDDALNEKIQDFYLQQQVATPISTKLVQQSREDASLAAEHIQLTHRIIGLIILSTVLVTFMAIFTLARLMHVSVTHRVLGLTEAAGEYSKGNLQARVAITGTDELAQLGTTFNGMADRLHKLVTTLEEMVVQRTKDLEVREAFFRQIFDHSSSAIAVYETVDQGQDFVFLEFNRTGEMIEGIKSNTIIGKRVSEVFPGLEEMGLLDVFRKVWQTGEPLSHPVSYYEDSKRKGWRQNRVYKMPTGEIVAMYDDRSHEKRAEKEKQIMEQQLLRAQKMEAIGMLAGGVAHDLNNILSSVVNYPEILLLQIDKASPLRSPLEQIRESGKRAAAVVADLLTVARGVTSKREIVNLNHLVSSFFSSPECSQIKLDHPHVHYYKHTENDIPHITCSTVHVIKCIMNLMINGSEAIEQQGSVTVSSKSEYIDSNQAFQLGISAGEYVILQVIDTGSGISDEDLDHIFEPFYTKKVMGKKSGTGLGLSIVWNTMQDHGGGVAVESSNAGTQFNLFFPKSDAELTSEGITPSLQELAGNGETILIIDDDPQQRAIASTILQKFGYTTLCQASGEDAFNYLQSHNVDLLILDMLMDPGINGRETFKQILAIHPKQKALLVSGFSKNAEVETTLAIGAEGFIMKPYSMYELGEAVFTILHPNSKSK